MNGKYKNKLGLVMGAVFPLILLCGCAEKGEQDGVSDTVLKSDAADSKGGYQSNAPQAGENSLTGEDGSWKGVGGCYKTEEVVWKDTVTGVYVKGDDIYCCNIDTTDDQYSMSVTKGEDTIYQSENILNMTCAGEGIWILEDTTDYSQNSGRKYELVQVGYDKQERYREDITDYLGDALFVRALCTDGDDRLFMLLEEDVIVFDWDGNYLCGIALDAAGRRMAAGSDGRVYVSVGGDNKEGSFAMSSDSGRGGEVLRLDVESQSAESMGKYEGYQLGAGGEGYLFTLVNEEGLYGVAVPEGKEEPVALWAELGLAFKNVKRAQFMSGGRFLVEDGNMAVVMAPADPLEVKHKTVLNLASVSRWSPFTDLAASFNISNDKYVVKIVDYSQGDQLSTREAADQLNLDIISGKYPDLFDFLMLPEDYYSDKGLLEDLYPYFDRDADIGREDFIGFDKLEKEGKLYYATANFNLDTAAGLYSGFGDSYGWSLQDYLDIQSRNSGEIMYNVTREGFLRRMVYRYAQDAVDWEKGTCDFDNPQFIGMLEDVAHIRENPEPEDPAELDFTPAERRLREGTLIAAVWYIDNVTEMAAAEAETGERLSFVGWPTPEGSCGTGFVPSSLVGICSMGNKEGAWEFVKYVLTEGAQQSARYAISTSRSVLEGQIAQAKEDYESGKSQAPYGDEQAERFYDLIDHSVYFGNSSEKVVDIIMEEAAAFLAGAKSAEETAKIIQSRVGILVAE